MKKKILFVSVLFLLAVCLFAVSVSATTVTDDDTDTVTLGACTINGLDNVTIPSPTVGLQYTLDDEAGTASVSGRGSFAGGDLVFPSSVTYEGKTYPLTKINSNLFQKLTYNLYVPDSVTFIGGGSATGTFGNSVIDKIYIGSGLKGFEQETFSGSKGYSVFVCKSKPTYIGVNAFNQNSIAAGGVVDYEFDLSQVVRFENRAFAGASFLQELVLGSNVEYIGSEAFVSCSNMKGSIIIPENCTISNRCFNGTALNRVVVKVAEGETKSLPTELFSGAKGGLTLVIGGSAIAGGNYIFSGNSTSVYMPIYADLQALVESVVTKSGSERISSVTFYVCDTGKSYTATKEGVITEKAEADTHIYTEETVHSPADCTRYERYSYICYACGNEEIVSQGDAYGTHILDVTVKEASCQSMGYIEHACTVCTYKETVHFTNKSAHSGTVESYVLKDYKTVTVTKRCEFCNTVVGIEDVSLVNKCFIEGYGFFDATLEYVSVSADGVATPSNASFDNAVIYFPSCVEINGEVVEVTTVQGFKAKSIKSIYIPDSVTRIAGGGGVGCFGDIATLKNVVVGKGVTRLEQEVFCMGQGATLDEFIFKGTITRLDYICLSNVKASSSDMPYEFNTALEYVGKWVNLNGTILREARLVKGCNLSEKFAFNNANGLKTVYIVGGDTPNEALDLGQEMMSNTATINIYIKGYVTVSGQAVLSGLESTRIYMSNTEAIDLFAAAIKAHNYSDRINKSTFMDCSTNTAWYISASADRVVHPHPNVEFSHGGLVESTEATCQQGGSVTERCFICGEITSTTSSDMMPHSFDCGVITVMPTENQLGKIVYTCLVCGEAKEETLHKDLGTHEENIVIYYPNGFTQAGHASITCASCNHTEERALEPIFVVLGYSVKEDRTGITCGFKVNLDALKFYEENMGAVKLGFIVANASDVATNGLVNESFELIKGNRGFQAEIEGRGYSCIDVRLSGANNDAMRAFDFLITGYVITDSDNDGSDDISYIQYSMENGDNAPITVGNQTLNTISIDRASPVE